MKPASRLYLGYLSTFVGVTLMGVGLHFAGEPQVRLGPATKSLIAGVSTVSGGVLSFGVGRRLLTSREEGPAGEPGRKDRDGSV